jgi:ectoine hydroxylase
MVIPGSHRVYVRCVGETPQDHFRESLRRQAIGVPDHDSIRRLAEDGGIEAPVGPAGSALFFECNLLHGSAGNLTPMPRTNLFLVFNAVSNRLVAPFGGQPPRPAFLAERPE